MVLPCRRPLVARLELSGPPRGPDGTQGVRPATVVMTSPPDEPFRRFGKTGKLRWRVLSVDHDRVSPCWTLSVRNREIYLTQRGTPDIKVSLHKSGDAYYGFVDHQRPRSGVGRQVLVTSRTGIRRQSSIRAGRGCCT